MNEIYVAFHEFFELVEADSTELRREVYGLRYQIFCEEHGYLDPTLYPEKLEKDGYDWRSFHVLLRHRLSGRFVGTVRLISQDPENINNPLPIEQYTKIDSSLLDINKLSRQHLVEISRFSILSEFAKRRKNPESSAVNMERRRFPNIFLALVIGVIRTCARHNMVSCVSIMDPTLNRLLSYFGLSFDPVGPLTEYHGKRRPYYVHLSTVFDRTYKKHRTIWELITDHGKLWPEVLERRKKSRLSTNNLAQGILTND